MRPLPRSQHSTRKGTHQCSSSILLPSPSLLQLIQYFTADGLIVHRIVLKNRHPGGKYLRADTQHRPKPSPRPLTRLHAPRRSSGDIISVPLALFTMQYRSVRVTIPPNFSSKQRPPEPFFTVRSKSAISWSNCSWKSFPAENRVVGDTMPMDCKISLISTVSIPRLLPE